MRLYYSIFKFVPDPVREECLNLGVVAVTEENEAAAQFNRKVRSRIRTLAPDFPIEQVDATVMALSERFASASQLRLRVSNLNEQVRTLAQLETLVESMNNQFQLSKPRIFDAESLSKGITELYQIFISPIVRRVLEAEHMTRQHLLALIWKTIRQWGENTPYTIIRHKPLRAKKAQHAADFWIQNGVPTAAIYAIPDDPLDLTLALAYRDSLPTVVDDFRELNSQFFALAVVPPVEANLSASPFLSETIAFLKDYNGIAVVRLDDLSAYKSKTIHQLI